MLNGIEARARVADSIARADMLRAERARIQAETERLRLETELMRRNLQTPLPSASRKTHEDSLDVNLRVLKALARHSEWRRRGYPEGFQAREPVDADVLTLCQDRAPAQVYCTEAARIAIAMGKNKLDEIDWLEMLLLAAQHASFSRVQTKTK